MITVDTTIAELRIHPVKGGGGIVVPRIVVGPQGPLRDHRWMIVDCLTGRFVAQRDERGRGIAIPQISQIRTAIDGDELVLTAPGMDELRLPLNGHAPGIASEHAIAVQLWGDTVAGVDQGAKADAWVTEYLGQFRLTGGYRLVRMADDYVRLTPDGLGRTTFTDAWPLLVGSTASLAGLNGRIAETRQRNGEPEEVPFGWDRFRPNVVLDGWYPYIEDAIVWMMAGGVQLVGTTRCKRCLTTTTNQATSVRGPEPLRTLNQCRRGDGGVVFLRNFRHASTGTIAVGDKVEMILAV